MHVIVLTGTHHRRHMITRYTDSTPEKFRLQYNEGQIVPYPTVPRGLSPMPNPTHIRHLTRDDYEAIDRLVAPRCKVKDTRSQRFKSKKKRYVGYTDDDYEQELLSKIVQDDVGFFSGERLNIWGYSILLELMNSGEFKSNRDCIVFCLLEYLDLPLSTYDSFSSTVLVRLGINFNDIYGKEMKARLPITLLKYIDKFCEEEEVDRSYVFTMAVKDLYETRQKYSDEFYIPY
jgi:hypothetical protein